MNEKINVSMGKNYNITTPTSNSSNIIGGITNINTSVTKQVSDKFKNFSTTVEEMDLNLTNDIETIENSSSNWLSSSSEILEQLRTLNNEEIEKLQSEIDGYEKKYQDYLSNIHTNLESEVQGLESQTYRLQLHLNTHPYAVGVETQISNLKQQLSGLKRVELAEKIQYISKHPDEFKSFMGISYEEYTQKIELNEITIKELQAKDYQLRQIAKEIPYLEIMDSEDFQNYLLSYEGSSEFCTALLRQLDYLDYLDEEQLTMFNYLNDTKSQVEAVDYLKAIKDKINQAKGREEAELFFSKILDEEGNVDVGWLEYNLKTSWQGLCNGTENFGEGFENLFDFTSDGMMTDNQYAQQFILQGLSELQSEGQLPKYIDDNYQISTSIGNMLPGSVISILTGGTFGNVLMGVSAAGNAKNDALVSMNDNKALAYLYGTLNGTSEAVLGKIMGNIPGLNEAAKFAGKEILSEGAEELIQTYVDAGLKTIIYGETPDLGELSEEAFQSFLYGCITSGIMTGGQAGIGFTINGTKYAYNSLNDLINAYAEGKIATVNTQNVNNTDSNTINDPTDDSAITKSNYYTAKGITQTFRFSDAEHIPARNSNFWNAFNNPELIQINVNGKLMTLDEAISYKMNYDLNAGGVEIDIDSKDVTNNVGSENNLNSIIKNLVQHQGINETMKGLWHYVYGNDLSYIPEQFRTAVQKFSAKIIEDLLTYEQIKSIADSDITTVNQNDTFDDLKEMKFNASYDSNDLSATAEMIPIGNLLDIIRNTSNFNEFIQKNDNRIIDVNYYVAFVQFVNVIKENNYNMRFNQLEQQRLDKIYNEALEKLPINKIQYNNVLPDDIKLKLMARDNIAYDRDLLLCEVKNKINKWNHNFDPYFIFDDLFLVYYHDVSTKLTIEEEKSGDYVSFDTCSEIYWKCLETFLNKNYYLDIDNFKKIASSISEFINFPGVPAFLSKHLNIYPNVYLDTSGLWEYYNSLPDKIKKAVMDNILEKNDRFLSRCGHRFYGIDQGVLKKHMQFKIKNLDWLTSETDFLSYLQNVRRYSLEDASAILSNLKSKKFSKYIYRISNSEYNIITEYIYDKCCRQNRFDVIDIIENSFEIEYTNEFEVKRLCKKLIERGMTKSEALRTISTLDSTGICSYAAVANAIVLAYKDNFQKFEDDFGYSLFMLIDGKLEFNAGELLLDMYTYINSNKCGGTMFSINETGELHVNNLITDNQKYLSGFRFHNVEDINKFLKSKNSDLSYVPDSKNFNYFEEGTVTLNDIMQLKDRIINHLNIGGSVGLGIYSTKEHQFVLLGDEIVTTKTWNEGGGHAVCITGVIDNFFVVSSWGKRYYISISDFINNEFNVVFRKVEGIK